MEQNEYLKKTVQDEVEKEENRLDKDYQLARAIDLIYGISIYEESLSEK